MTRAADIPLEAASAPGAVAPVGVVVIGRNEAPRLTACLGALRDRVADLVYVDSGSTDGSPLLAAQLGARVVRLAEGPFTAARGRDAGTAEALRADPGLEFIQFVDGDCIIDPGWFTPALDHMRQNPRVGIVAGRLREQHRDASLLIRIVDVDWDLPTGQTDAVGGIFLARTQAVCEVGGWRSDLIAGEELDLSARIIERGWQIHRIPAEMTLHDIGIRSPVELWRRARRTGHAYAQLASLHGARYARWRRRTQSNLGYGLGVPLLALAAGVAWWPAAILVLLIYPVLALRLARWRLGRGDSLSLALAYGAVTTVCKIASGIGAARFYMGRLFHRPSKLIEYKKPRPAPGAPP
jgi:GT2 family glycosyltransferase